MSNRCADCGMALHHADEYHPYVFCVLTNRGLDPWLVMRTLCRDLGMGEPPHRPRTRDLPALAPASPS